LSLDESCSTEDVHICGTCTNVECEVHKDNFIGSIASVMSLEECQDWCDRRNDYMNDCQYITYFGNEGLPVQNICYLLSSCGKKSECTNCVTETSDCLCSSNKMGKIKSTNLLNDIADIQSEEDCRQKCRDNSKCEFYTYLTESLECFLLTQLIEPSSKCNGCRTGKANCTESPTTPTTTETTSTTTSTIQGCPSTNWTLVNDKCYRTSPINMNWPQAKKWCEDRGGWLAEIFSAEEQSSINTWLKGSGVYWLGLTDIAVEGKFVWQHSSKPLELSRWHPPEPDNYHGIQEDCVCAGLYGNDLLEWSDITCDDNNNTNLDTNINHKIYALCEYSQE